MQVRSCATQIPANSLYPCPFREPEAKVSLQELEHVQSGKSATLLRKAEEKAAFILIDQIRRQNLTDSRERNVTPSSNR